MNEYDSGRLGEFLSARGWQLTSRREEADFIFFNTCSIREKAARRVLNHLEQARPLKKKKPGLIIGVGGCVAEQEGQALLERAPWLDLVIGPQHLPRLPDLLENFTGRQALTGSGQRPAWSRENLAGLGRTADGLRSGDSVTNAAFPSLVTLEPKLEAKRPLSPYPAAAGSVTADHAAEHDPAWNIEGDSEPGPEQSSRLLGSVTIMQGCNNYCAYCVVPYLRGPELSREVGDILDEVENLLKAGVQDLTLLGQNVNSYGQGLTGAPSFPDLLKMVADLGAPRLRFTTSHPKDFSPELVRLFGDLGPLCESLHLPVQSGSDNILKSMGRVYSRDSYLKLVDELRSVCPDLSITTDIIVGFPGESEADFEQTMGLIETVNYDAMFSFKYSDRPGTKAIEMKSKISEEEKGRRLTALQRRQKEITLTKNAAHVGQTLEVLVERVSERYRNQLTGRARNYKLVHFDGPAELIGQTVPVTITEGWAASLRGKMDR